jgi:formate hydrogenlyase subunit 6/NADH:ubiquinone oxidoreductase subunit I
MRPSKRFVRLIEKNFTKRFFYAKFTHYPIVRSIVKRMLFDKNDITYLTKDNIVEITLNKRIEPIESIVVPSKIIEYFINKSSYHFIMDFCLCREAMPCSNYPIELGCLFMGDAAKKIPEELGRPVTKEEAFEHVKKCREAGLVHLIGRDKLDETWLGVGSKIPLITVCNCCNCCCLWKMLPHLDDTLSSTVKGMPGVKMIINKECTGCGTCKDNVCFIDNIKIKDGVAEIGKNCLACGRCAEICPNNAIELIIEDEDFINKTIERVNKAVSY